MRYTCCGHVSHDYALILWDETASNLGRKLPKFLGNIDAFLSDYTELCRRIRQNCSVVITKGQSGHAYIVVGKSAVLEALSPRSLMRLPFLPATFLFCIFKDIRCNM